jgi:hypothetical protein
MLSLPGSIAVRVIGQEASRLAESLSANTNENGGAAGAPLKERAYQVSSASNSRGVAAADTIIRDTNITVNMSGLLLRLVGAANT